MMMTSMLLRCGNDDLHGVVSAGMGSELWPLAVKTLTACACVHDCFVDHVVVGGVLWVDGFRYTGGSSVSTARGWCILYFYQWSNRSLMYKWHGTAHYIISCFDCSKLNDIMLAGTTLIWFEQHYGGRIVPALNTEHWCTTCQQGPGVFFRCWLIVHWIAMIVVVYWLKGHWYGLCTVVGI